MSEGRRTVAFRMPQEAAEAFKAIEGRDGDPHGGWRGEVIAAVVAFDQATTAEGGPLLGRLQRATEALRTVSPEAQRAAEDRARAEGRAEGAREAEGKGRRLRAEGERQARRRLAEAERTLQNAKLRAADMLAEATAEVEATVKGRAEYVADRKIEVAIGVLRELHGMVEGTRWRDEVIVPVATELYTAWITRQLPGPVFARLEGVADAIDAALAEEPTPVLTVNVPDASGGSRQVQIDPDGLAMMAAVCRAAADVVKRRRPAAHPVDLLAEARRRRPAPVLMPPELPRGMDEAALADARWAADMRRTGATCGFRGKADNHSDNSRTVSPIESGQSLR